MKISTETASTHLYTPKIKTEINAFAYGDRSEFKVIENDIDDLDIGVFQRQMSSIQQRVIQQQIQKYHHMNLQKQFPPLLKLLQQQSQKLITLETRLATTTQQHSCEQAKLQQLKQQMQQQKEQLEQSLFQLESQRRLECQYEKQLILGNVECLESRVKELMEEREEVNGEREDVMGHRDLLVKQIQKEKQMILKLAIKKGQIQEEINFIKTCQIQPIHLLKQKALKLHQANTNHFQEKFINPSGLIANYCQNIQTINENQFDQMYTGNQYKCISQGLALQQRLVELRKRLDMISSAKIKINQYINVQLLRHSILMKQIDHKHSHVKLYQQLLTSIQNHPYCISLPTHSNHQTTNQIVKDSQLQQIVINQSHQNSILQNKLNQLVQRLNGQRQANVKLNRLLSEVRIDHHMRTNKMIAENDVLKEKLQTKKKIYFNKIELNQPMVSVFTRQKPYEKTNCGSGKTKTYIEKQEAYTLSGFKPSQLEQRSQWGIKSANNEFQNINIINRRVQPSKQSPQKQQSLSSRMNQLRGRLMRKFQQAEHIKK